MVETNLKAPGPTTSRINKCGRCRLPKRTSCICPKVPKPSGSRDIDGRAEGASSGSRAATRNILVSNEDEDSDHGSDCVVSEGDSDGEEEMYTRAEERFGMEADEADEDEETDDSRVADVLIDASLKREIDIPSIAGNPLRSPSGAYTSRREVPDFTSKRNERSGPANISGGRRSPTDIFDLLWTDEIIDTFIESTNAFAINTGRKPWKPVTKACLNGFFAIALFTGLKNTPVRRWLWDESQPLHYSKFVADIMSRHRFEDILACFHWVDTSIFSPAQKKEKNSSDCFWRMARFLEILKNNFMSHWNCNQAIDVDEQGIPAKCYHTAIQYNGDKPYKWFFKVYSLNDGGTSYMHNFYLFRGKDVSRVADGVSASAYPVVSLTRHACYENRNHILYSDNYFQSISLCNELMNRGIHCVGTLRINRIPKTLVSKDWYYKSSTAKNPIERGACKTMKLNDSLYITTWFDKRPVNMISTFSSSKDLVSRWYKDKRTKRSDEISIFRPLIVGFYNSAMGGTDQFDQWLSYYRIAVRSKYWPHRIFFHFFLCCVINAYIIHRSLHNLKKHDKYHDLLSFLTEVMLQLATRSKPEKPVAAVFDGDYVQRKRARATAAFQNPARLVGEHFPYCMPSRDPSSKKDIRSYCTYPGCGLRSSIYCDTCCVAFCVVPRPDGTCFRRFHTEQLI